MDLAQEATREALSEYWRAQKAWAARPARPLVLDGGPNLFEVLLDLYGRNALHIPTALALLA